MFGINFLDRFKKTPSYYEITECFTDAELEQYQNNGGNFFTAVQRCSYDDWRQNSSLTTYEEYEQEHLPDNLLDYCARLLPELESTIKGELSSDFPFIALLIGDKYREWLGDRKNTKETRTAYSKEMLAFADLSAEDFNKELHGTGLNISTWYYLLPINAVPKDKVFDGRINCTPKDGHRFWLGISHTPISWTAPRRVRPHSVDSDGESKTPICGHSNCGTMCAIIVLRASRLKG